MLTQTVPDSRNGPRAPPPTPICQHVPSQAVPRCFQSQMFPSSSTGLCYSYIRSCLSSRTKALSGVRAGTCNTLCDLTSHPPQNNCPDPTPRSQPSEPRGSGSGFPMGPRVGVGDGMARPRPHRERIDGASIVGVAVRRPGRRGEQSGGGAQAAWLVLTLPPAPEQMF